MSDGVEVYPEDSLTAQAVLLAVETGVPPESWLELGLVGMNTAMMYLRNRMKREAAYFGHRIRDGSSPGADNEGRQTSG